MVISSDTAPKVERIRVDRLRKMPAWRKLELMVNMNETVRLLALAGLRQRYPDDSSALLGRRLADLVLGAELASRAYGPLSEEI